MIDTDSNTVVDTIPVGDGPNGVAITRGLFDSRAYVGNGSSDNVSVIDTDSNTVVDTIPVGDGPFGVAIGK